MKELRPFLPAALLWLVLVLLGPAVIAQTPADLAAKRLVEVPLSETPALSKRALVIGVDDYQVAHKLTDCGNDAKAFAGLLTTKFGFEHVTVMTDGAADPALRPTYTNLRHQLRLLLAGVVPDKTELVLFFSGHGTRTHDAVGDQDWLVPEDGDPQDVAHTCVSYSEFRSQIDTKRPARALLVMDACRDLYAGKGVTGSGFGEARRALGPQVAELQSCQPTQVSQEGAPGDFSQSVFTHFLIAGLSGDPDAVDAGSKNITFDSLKEYVQQQVSQYVADKFSAEQLPDGQTTSGRMVLARVSPSVVAPPQVAVVAPQPAPSPPIIQVPVSPPVITPSPPTVTPSGPVAGAVKVNPKDGAAMVYVPAGPFLMGDDDWSDNPRHTVTLSGYWMYKTPVTVAQYRKFCHAKGAKMPSAPKWGWKDDHPIVNVTWDDAKAYCDWAGVHLPTEAQWEKAARGTDGRTYPWGNDWNRRRLSNSADELAVSTSPVGSFPSGASPYGCLDMAGNVRQWCSDWYDRDYWESSRGPDPTGPASGQDRVQRGSSWNYFSAADNFRASFRAYDNPDSQYVKYGFRGASGG